MGMWLGFSSVTKEEISKLPRLERGEYDYWVIDNLENHGLVKDLSGFKNASVQASILLSVVLNKPGYIFDDNTDDEYFPISREALRVALEKSKSEPENSKLGYYPKKEEYLVFLQNILDTFDFEKETLLFIYL